MTDRFDLTEQIEGDATADQVMTAAERARRAPRDIRTPGRGRPLKEETEERRPVIEQYIAEGMKDAEIAALVGVDRKAVGYIREHTSRPARKNGIGHIQPGTEATRADAEIMRLYGEGLTYVQIAEEIGLSYANVRARLTRAYAAYADKIKDTVAGRQYADIQMMKEELLEIIIRDAKEDLEALREEGDGIDEFDALAVHALIEKAFQKGRKNIDTKFKAMEVFLKLCEREAKIFGIDAASNVNVSHTVRVEPEAIELLGRLERARAAQSDIIDAEVIDEPLELGSM